MNKFTILAITLTILACSSQSQLPAPKKVSSYPSATASPLYATICNGETVRAREGAGTAYPERDVLEAGERVELLPAVMKSLDGGTWRETSAGWVNVRYLCE